MATKQLTPRQQEIKTLLDSGKTPAEAAKALKISENAVYQHLARMKKAKTGSRSTTRSRTARSGSKRTTSRSRTTARSSSRSGGTKRSTTRRSSSRKPPARPAPAPPAEVQVREMTPLQAIRHRRQEIESQIAESSRRVADAEKVFNSERDSHAKLEASRDDELKKLKAAEAALSDAKPKKRSSSRNGTGSKSAAAKAAAAATPAPAQAPAQAEPAPAAPEPVEPPTGDEALAAVGAETGHISETIEQERPGAETLPEFAQEDGFEDGADGAAE